MLVPPESSSAVLVMISSKSVSMCNRSHARRVISGKIIRFLRGTPLHPAARNLSQKNDSTLVSLVPESISLGLASVPGRDRQTDGRTDGQNYDS